jgi:hypothetical protein
MTDKIATVALLRHGGSHLIRPIVAALGFEILEPGNFGAPPDRAEGPVIVWLRDPRDRMVSTMRFWNGEGPRAKPKKAASLRRYGADPDAWLAGLLGPEGFMEHMRGWARTWCYWPGACISRFEDMRRDGPGEISRIAQHLSFGHLSVGHWGAGPASALYARVFEQGSTFTGHYSDWRSAFGPRARAAWDELGGAELLRVMGYE